MTIAVDAAGAPQARVPLLVRTTGAEVGARTAIVPGLVSTLSLFYLQSDSELTFDGDSGDTQPNGPTRRYGVEWANFYKPMSWLTLSADASYTYARYLQPQGAADGRSGFYIANSIPLVVSAAARVETPAGVFGSVRLRYFSSQPILEDDVRRAAGVDDPERARGVSLQAVRARRGGAQRSRQPRPTTSRTPIPRGSRTRCSRRAGSLPSPPRA